MSANNEIINPNEHLSIPKWINVDYFKRILDKDEPDYKDVLEFTPTAAIPPGENFTSVMIRIHMKLKMKDGSTKPKTYVLKTCLEAQKGGEEVERFGLFPKEYLMYNKFLPAFEELYKAAGKTVQLGPKCVHTEKKENGNINFIFEDLKIRNFQNIDRTKGCDVEHMRRLLEKLAQFHAASAVYVERDGDIPKEFFNGFINMETGYEQMKLMYESRMDGYKKAMSVWGLEEADKIIKKLPTLEQYWRCGKRTMDTKDNSFNVLTHGDFWSSNAMFSYKADGSIDEVLLLDFQICKWGTPAEDLLFLLTLSSAEDIRITEFDHFVEIYYEYLIEALKLLKYKKPLPKLRELHMSMYSETSTFYAFFAVFNHLFLILLPTDKDSNIDTLMRDDEKGREFRFNALTRPPFVKAMNDLYPFFVRRGLFNFQDYD